MEVFILDLENYPCSKAAGLNHKRKKKNTAKV